jgi:Protein of unknown function (DUF4236)
VQPAAEAGLGVVMPFHVRDSVSIGPFRINLSNTGTGFSLSVKGFRLLTGVAGHHIQIGSSGIRYRKVLGGIGRRGIPMRKLANSDFAPEIVKLTTVEELPTYITEDGILMQRIISANVDLLLPESHLDALASLNKARERPAVSPILYGAAIIGLILSIILGHAFLATGFTLLLGVAYAVGQLVDIPRRTAVFAYTFEEEAEKRYKDLISSIDQIGAACKIWFVKASGNITTLHAWKTNGGASSLLETIETSVTYALPRGISSNVTPPMITVDGKKCYFFPDCILVEQAGRFGAVRYEYLRTDSRDQNMIVDAAPKDSRVVGSTWRFVNKNGSPDRRFNNNRQVPICQFEEIALVSDSGFKGLLQVSKPGISRDFCTRATNIGRFSREMRDSTLLVAARES